MTKIHDESRFWGQTAQSYHRCFKLNAYNRTEHVKNWLHQSLLLPNSTVSATEAIAKVTNFAWLAKKQMIQLKPDSIIGNASLISELERYGSKQLVMTYDEYRFTFS